MNSTQEVQKKRAKLGQLLVSIGSVVFGGVGFLTLGLVGVVIDIAYGDIMRSQHPWLTAGRAVASHLWPFALVVAAGLGLAIVGMIRLRLSGVRRSRVIATVMLSLGSTYLGIGAIMSLRLLSVEYTSADVRVTYLLLAIGGAGLVFWGLALRRRK
ncbi:hypothetical protein ACFOWY_14220 [Lysinibacter cavernae]|uniref:Uncharacterized protein n=1 Tax=Lysinibacter cavernae TaxID=1640652 RepID=A0A7X5R112_9MICO|nr:hypothetical protein [Lysinibacter cavernae]NIH53532.1 hypothetical protein [Lysinibacter cavernae]